MTKLRFMKPLHYNNAVYFLAAVTSAMPRHGSWRPMLLRNSQNSMGFASITRVQAGARGAGVRALLDL